MLAVETAKLGLPVTAGADLAALLGFEKQRQLMGCSDTSCMAELAGSLGVPFLINSEVANVGGVWLVSMSLLDASKGQAIRRSSEQAGSEREVVAATLKALRELLQPFAKPTEAPAAPGTPAAAPATPGGLGTPKASAETTPTTSTQRTLGYVLDGAGLAILAAGGICGGLVLDSTAQAKAAVDRRDAAALATAKSEAQLRMNAADALFITGAVALAAGLVVTFTAPSATTIVSVAPMQGGIGLSAAGVLP
ncbi:MAG: hypothetical protein QM765_15620 [Myxococcales bacterium]